MVKAYAASEADGELNPFEFAARHDIRPVIETYRFEQVKVVQGDHTRLERAII